MSFYDPTVGFRKTDQDFLNLCKQYRLLDGSTAVVAMIIDNKIITAHAGFVFFVFFFLNQRTNLQRKKYNKKNKKKKSGDSRAVLCRDKKAIRLTEDHKPERADELARVEDLGQQIKKKKWTLLQIQKKLNVCYKSKKLTLLQIQKKNSTNQKINLATNPKKNSTLFATKLFPETNLIDWLANFFCFFKKVVKLFSAGIVSVWWEIWRCQDLSEICDWKNPFLLLFPSRRLT